MSDFRKFRREEITDELKDRDQWLLWDASAERKQPFTLDHRGELDYASWNDPDDWLSFQAAADFAEDRDHIGIGYVFAKSNDDYPRGVYGGLDLDGCFEDGTPADWLPELQPFVDRDAYIEFSPSRANPEKDRHGAHIPLAGFEPPDWWSDVSLGDHEGVEAYGSKFFTFTGDLARSSGDEIADTGEWVDEWLADAYEAITGETAPPRRDDDQTTIIGDDDGGNGDGGDDGDYDDEWLDRELVEEALSHIPPSVDYKDWRDIGFAVADFFDNSTTAYSVFANWSRRSSKWDDEAERLAEDIVNRGDGDVTVATLVYKAKQNGWEPPKREKQKDPGPSLKELAARHLDQFDDPEDVPDGFLADVTAEQIHAGETGDDTAEADGGTSDTENSQTAADGGETTTETATSADWSPDDRTHEERVERRIYSQVLVPLDPPEDTDIDEIGIQTAIHRTAEIFNEAYHWIRPRSDTRGWRDTLYNYVREEGIYEPHGEAEAERLAERYLGEFATNEFVNQLVGKLERMNRVRAKRLDESPERLVVENGILDLTTGELSEHSPGEFHRTRLDVAWNPDAELDAIDSFLDDVVDGKDVDRLYRFVAHTLYKDYPGEKAAMLLGEGRNGKSMFLELVEEFLGEFNTAHQPLRDLNEDRWAAAYLNGKLANVVPDMSDQTPDSMQKFKALTGGDTVSGDVKFENPVRFTNHATLMFACNSMPVLHDDTRGNWRRWQLINFPHTFDNDDPDAKDAEPKEALRERLCQSEEFQGLLVRCVEEIQRWAQDPQEPFFPDADGWKVTRAKMRKAAEPVYDFAHACLRPNDESELPKEEVRECYRRYATEEGLSKFSDEEFGRRLLGLTDFNVESGRLRSDEGPNHRVNVYKGVEFTDRAKSLMRDESPSSAAQKTTDDFAPDASTKGSTAETQRVLETLRRNADDQGTVSRGALAEQLTRRFDLDLDEAKGEIETALQNGAIMDSGDGLRET